MEIADLATSPPPPERVITTWASSRGQDLLGLRAPAERIANALMDGVTTISPLVRYIGFRAWVIHRYAALGGLDSRDAFYAFAGKCEAALVIGHRLAEEPTLGLVGSREATRLVQEGGPYVLQSLAQALAMDAYAGPSQDLAIAVPRVPVPGLSVERGRPLATEVARKLDDLPALATIDADSVSQEVDASELAHLASTFPMTAPSGLERDLLVDAVCPPKPRPGETARLAAYCYLLHLANTLTGSVLDENAVLTAAIAGEESGTPNILYPVADGWLRFLVRDVLVASHERAVSVVLALLQEAPHESARADTLTLHLAHLDPEEVLEDLGLPGFGAGSSIGDLYAAVREATTPGDARGGLRRWQGALGELAICHALDTHPEPNAVALLPVAWMLAAIRAGDGLTDHVLSVDVQSGAAVARLGLGDVVVPMVRSWEGSAEALASVIAKLIRRSVDQHLAIAWYRLQADPRRNVALIVSDSTVWSKVGTLAPGRATSRLYQAINWLHQLRLIDDAGLTPDGRAILERGLQSLAGGSASP